MGLVGREVGGKGEGSGDKGGGKLGMPTPLSTPRIYLKYSDTITHYHTSYKLD